MRRAITTETVRLNLNLAKPVFHACRVLANRTTRGNMSLMIENLLRVALAPGKEFGVLTPAEKQIIIEATNPILPPEEL